MKLSRFESEVRTLRSSSTTVNVGKSYYGFDCGNQGIKVSSRRRIGDVLMFLICRAWTELLQGTIDLDLDSELNSSKGV